jgi:Gamma interferon inducible lysosomal thiol reductase (GILT)
MASTSTRTHRSINLLVLLFSLLGLAASATQVNHQASDNGNDNDNKLVSVIFYGESQCPYCREFVTEAWPPVWNDPELRALIQYDFIPWGNAYYPTLECGSGPYDATERHCWYAKCVAPQQTEAAVAVAAAVRNIHKEDEDDTCFTGAPIYQHSLKEGQMDIYESCVKLVLGLERAVAFTLCAEGPNMEDPTLATAHDLMQHCLLDDNDDVMVQTIQHCFTAQGTILEAMNAIQTPDHPGVPYVLVDGEALDDPLNVKAAICQRLKLQLQNNARNEYQPEKVDLPVACQDSPSKFVRLAQRVTGIGTKK